MVQTVASQLTIPVFVKIRLLATLEQTIEVCAQLGAAGAALIAIHARHRVNLADRSANARGGPALLEQVTAIRAELHRRQRLLDPGDSAPPKRQNAVPFIIANGNVREHADVSAHHMCR